MKHIILLLSILLASPAWSAILVYSPSGTVTQKATLYKAATDADAAGKTVVITSALSAVQSNISSASVHSWPSDRSLEVKKGGSINPTTKFTGLKTSQPEWFGVKGDGTTDDTLKLRKWLASGPKNLELDGGKTYLVAPVNTGDVILPFTGPVKFNGNGAIIKVKDSSLEYDAILGGSSAGLIDLTGSTVENVTFDHNGYNNDFTVTGSVLNRFHATFQTQNGGDITFKNNHVLNAVSTNCVVIKGATGRFTVTGNTFLNVGADYSTEYDHSTIYPHGPDVIISDNYGQGNYAGAFIETHATKQRVQNNTVTGYQGGLNISGIYLWGDSEDSIVSGNIIEAKQFGIRMLSVQYAGQPAATYGLHNFSVYGNVIKLHHTNNTVLTSKYGMGIGIQPGTTLPVHNVKIDNNIVEYDLETVATSYGSLHVGIGVLETSTATLFDNISITNNQVINSPGPGIILGIGGGGTFRNAFIGNNQLINPGQSLAPSHAQFHNGIHLAGGYYSDTLTVLKQDIVDGHAATRLIVGVHLAAGTDSTACSTDIDANIFLVGDGVSFTYSAVNNSSRLLPVYTARLNKAPTLANHTMKLGSQITDTSSNTVYKKLETGIAWVTQTYGVAMPTTGTYTAGSVVINTTPSTAVPAEKWLRLTTGSNHVLNTDWAAK